ncbi:Aste57867_10721 [Aphanomyces stellatus]|uniref:Leucine carboxyl methyltransferase 1 n=1 Tax=Aphanomyces stellatus TaxID=120398 RepID=A0A485KR35_9STRA|nr:hypothetical protein As57867_010681 [Aphanomyces stellatus]VFT87591.1 Aste57867_10721 [Aphanomyces stellatus]
MESSLENDTSVQETASDAAACKLSAVRLGYWEDPFASMFAKPNRKMPIINRGYYARARSIELLIHRFFATPVATPSGGGNQPHTRQVIVLGAGQDSMFFRLKTQHPDLLATTMYVELDFPAVTRSKVRLCRRHKVLADALGPVETNETELKAQGYALLACDLRDLKTVQSKLATARINPQLPTLILSECVLCYMNAEDSLPLLSWIGASFADAAVVVYEQIRPHDAFGQTMVENIHMRGCDLKSIFSCVATILCFPPRHCRYPEADDQRRRFLDVGFAHVDCWDMNKVYYEYLDVTERKQKERLELFDEVEEFHMLQGHYCLVVASKQATSSIGDAVRLTANESSGVPPALSST